MAKRKGKLVELALYKGEELLCIGTALEIAQYLGIKKETVNFYLTPAYERRVNKRKKTRKAIAVVKLDD